VAVHKTATDVAPATQESLVLWAQSAKHIGHTCKEQQTKQKIIALQEELPLPTSGRLQPHLPFQLSVAGAGPTLG